MAADFSFLRVERRDRLAVVTINRPDKLNALNAAIVGEVRQAFEELRADKDVRGVDADCATDIGDRNGASGIATPTHRSVEQRTDDLSHRRHRERHGDPVEIELC